MMTPYIDWDSPTRTCPSCPQNGPQPLENFYVCATRLNNRSSKCKPCQRAQTALHRKQVAMRRVKRKPMQIAPRLTQKKHAPFMTGSWPTLGANPRHAVAAKATSKSCWKQATWVVSAPTSTPCSSACAARWVCPPAMCMAFAWYLRPLATKSCRAIQPA